MSENSVMTSNTAPSPTARRALDPAVVEHVAVAAAMQPIVTINDRGEILSASDSIKGLLGWTPEELIGASIGILMPEPHRGRHQLYIDEHLRTGRSTVLGQPRRMEAVHRNGHLVPVELCVSRADVPGSGSPLFVGILIDARAHRTDPEAEAWSSRLHALLAEQTAALQAAHLRLRLADRMASVGTLSAGLGHDMQNILLPVRAHLAALSAALQEPLLRGHVEAVQRAVDCLQQLSYGLHFLALDPDRENLEQTCALHTWWSQAGAILTKAVPKHVQVKARIPRALPKVGVAPHRLTQAVLNLVVNAGEAIPATRAGRVVIQAFLDPSTDASPAAESMVRIRVIDNGIGMTPEVLRRACELFFTTKPRGLGTGLGLAMARSVAEQAGGRMEIETEPEHGTSISLLLPGVDRSRSRHPARGPRSALITLADRRAAALVEILLQQDEVPAKVSDDPLREPTAATLWITEPATDRLEAAVRWLSEGPNRRLVLFGSPLPSEAGAWTALTSHIIEDPRDLKAVRDALARALARVNPPETRS